MMHNTIISSLFLIFSGAAILSTLALYTRQSLLVAYILLGIVLGPWGLKLIANPQAAQHIGDVGIIFLLFLLGLHLHPQSLLHVLKKVTWVALVSSLIFASLGFGFGKLFGYSTIDSVVIGIAMMFSSTIIGLKLLPTTVLHHQHTGEVMIGILLLQDLIAIMALLLINGLAVGNFGILHISLVVLSLPGLLLFAFLFERYVLIKLFAKFDKIREYIFLISIAWCLGMSILAEQVHLSAEVGAFIAGVSIATSPIALYIAESLKPIRDFFLVLFFFSVGASFNLEFFSSIAIPSLVLAIVLLLIKPLVFYLLLRQTQEPKYVSWEVGVRLGQVSEFSLLMAYLASNVALISSSASYLIQSTTVLTFIASSYFVVKYYPTPVAMSEKLRRD
jgi:Kef-type K+ transport system membrane component KefB